MSEKNAESSQIHEKDQCPSVEDIINKILVGVFQLFLLLVALCFCWVAWVLLSVLGCFFN